MFTRTFLQDTAERAIKTFAQTIVAVLAIGVPLWSVDWMEALGLALTAALVSLLTSIASGGFGNRGTASLTHSVLPSPKELPSRLVEFSDLVTERGEYTATLPPQEPQ